MSATDSVSSIFYLNNTETENVNEEINGYSLVDTIILHYIFNCVGCPKWFQLETTNRKKVSPGIFA